MSETKHPEEGDTLMLTDTVYRKGVLGTGLPANAKLANEDQRFDRYPVTVENIKQIKIDGRISKEVLTLKKPNGETVKVQYKGREPIAGNAGESIIASNRQRATQLYTWEKKE